MKKLQVLEDQTETFRLQVQDFNGLQPSPTSTRSFTRTARLTPWPWEEEERGWGRVSTVTLNKVMKIKLYRQRHLVVSPKAQYRKAGCLSPVTGPQGEKGGTYDGICCVHRKS